METKSVTYKEVLSWNDEQALAFIERRRWSNGPICPKCGSVREPYSITRKSKTKNKVTSIYRCKDCKKDFTATVGTIFEGSHIPLSTWLAAIFDIVQSKKGISAHQLHRKYDITYKSALFMAHRIRFAMRNKSFDKLTGTVEADATYVGGKTRRGHKVVHERIQDEIEMGLRPKHPGLKRGQRHPRMDKVVVLGAVERGGSVRTQVVKAESGPEVRPILSKNVDLANVHLMTDGSSAYHRISEYGQHDVVNHEVEYARGNVHTQNIEGYWSILKRGIIGTFHHVSEHRLPMYLNEFEYRFNQRKITDADRFEALVSQTHGRLDWYRQSQD